MDTLKIKVLRLKIVQLELTAFWKDSQNYAFSPLE